MYKNVHQMIPKVGMPLCQWGTLFCK